MANQEAQTVQPQICVMLTLLLDSVGCDTSIYSNLRALFRFFLFVWSVGVLGNGDPPAGLSMCLSIG